MVKTIVTIQDVLYKRLREEAFTNMTSQSEVVEKALMFYWKSQDDKKSADREVQDINK